MKTVTCTKYTAEVGAIYVRPDTVDESVIKDVINSYSWMRLSRERVLDIGAHIGAFVKLAVYKGARTVSAFEPVLENFELLRTNAEHVELFNQDVPILYNSAVVGGDCGRDVEIYVGKGKITSVSTLRRVRGRERRLVEGIPLVHILRETRATAIKMDCEGAEYQILDRPLPDHVRQFALELHHSKETTAEDEARVRALFDGWEKVVDEDTSSLFYRTRLLGWRR